MHLPFNFLLAQLTGRDAAAIRDIVERVERACDGQWSSLVLSNHDIDRGCDRFADGAGGDAVAKLLAALLLTLRGAPFVYYGEEIAMRTDPPESLAAVQDPVGRSEVLAPLQGRDGVRRPMQWDGSPGAGFSRAAPWLRVSRDSAERNVEGQLRDPDSVLRFYRTLLQARRDSAALASGARRCAGLPASWRSRGPALRNR